MIKIEKLKIKHLSEFAQMLGEQWDLGKSSSQAEGQICAVIYLLDILKESSELLAASDGGELLAVAGYFKTSSKKSFLRRKLSTLLQKIAWLSPKIKNKEALKKYYETYEVIPEDMKKNFDCELSILIAKNKVRGKGIGSKIFNTICELAKKDGCKNMFIETDDSCTHTFYERNGCTKFFEKEVVNGELGSEQAYVFEKNL